MHCDAARLAADAAFFRPTLEKPQLIVVLRLLDRAVDLRVEGSIPSRFTISLVQHDQQLASGLTRHLG
jgi:hypothetical protein